MDKALSNSVIQLESLFSVHWVVNTQAPVTVHTLVNINEVFSMELENSNVKLVFIIKDNGNLVKNMDK